MLLHARVAERYHGWTLRRYLAERFRYLDAAGWEAFADAGQVFCGERAIGPDFVLEEGIIVSCLLPDVPEPPADLGYRIVHEDAWLLGVDKPGNLLVHRRGRALTGNLIYQLRFCHSPAYPEADIVNRLDRCTSGVVLLARDRQTLARLHEAFAGGQVVKRYLGVVHGRPQPESGCIALPLFRLPDDGPPRFGVAAPGGGKAALTEYRVIRCLGECSLVELRPRTGRTHQLRVHMSAIGHPLVGDPLYGAAGGESKELTNSPACNRSAAPLRFPRQALHCESLHFRHPASGEPITITAPLPADMEELCRSLCSPATYSELQKAGGP